MRQTPLWHRAQVRVAFSPQLSGQSTGARQDLGRKLFVLRRRHTGAKEGTGKQRLALPTGHDLRLAARQRNAIRSNPVRYLWQQRPHLGTDVGMIKEAAIILAAGINEAVIDVRDLDPGDCNVGTLGDSRLHSSVFKVAGLDRRRRLDLDHAVSLRLRQQQVGPYPYPLNFEDGLEERPPTGL